MRAEMLDALRSELAAGKTTAPSCPRPTVVRLDLSSLAAWV